VRKGVLWTLAILHGPEAAGRCTWCQTPAKRTPAPTKRGRFAATPSGGCFASVPTISCDGCYSEEPERHNAKFVAARAARLARMRAEGRSPTDSAEARQKIGNANAKRLGEAFAWDRTHEKPDPEVPDSRFAAGVPLPWPHPHKPSAITTTLQPRPSRLRCHGT
jgi:hypothetical protein